MAYCLNTNVTGDFNSAMVSVREKLAAAGFGVLSEIDISAKMKEKLGVDFRPYIILGACNPPYAHKALTAEPYIGTMLPCNVIVQEWEDGRVEVSAINPVASMQAVENPALIEIAVVIRDKLQGVIKALQVETS
ncbi:MAG: hypothetical protein C0622_07295 [Desulfuromonas sp.]|nr:MAG: hypothetical protein C0622_07295 [Desulfuromonas sp.]